MFFGGHLNFSRSVSLELNDYKENIWLGISHKNTRNSAAQWSFLLCLNISCILSKGVHVCVFVFMCVSACRLSLSVECSLQA